MAKLLMSKTVFDGKVYHKAGEIIEVKPEVEKWYLGKGFAKKLDDKIIDELEEIESSNLKWTNPEVIEPEVIETKEEKKVYRKRK
jgi:predicted GNAT family acetyltransferase